MAKHKTVDLMYIHFIFLILLIFWVLTIFVIVYRRRQWILKIEEEAEDIAMRQKSYEHVLKLIKT